MICGLTMDIIGWAIMLRAKAATPGQELKLEFGKYKLVAIAEKAIIPKINVTI